ncbi:MAG TPA: YihY/virulence factor BrkB family protein [Bryobacteraceae bacterium]|nr:YihY/virulence factor BrkB family protein [Bryobacteraceae bacterium]
MLYLLRRTLVASFDDGLFVIAKGAAYSALLSLFPILASTAAILVEARADYVRRNIARFLAHIVPPGTEDVVLQQFRYSGKRPAALLAVAIVLSIWAAASVVKSLMDGFNAAYRVPRNRSFVAHNGVGLMLVFLSVVPMAGASSLVLFGGTIENQVLKVMKVDPALNPLTPFWQMFWQVVRYLVAFAATSTLTAILYHYGPYRKQMWRRVWPGAFLATILWMLATAVFAWYVRHITNYNVIYGSVGTSMALLLWMYLLTAIALFGCEFNAELERMEVAAG